MENWFSATNLDEASLAVIRNALLVLGPQKLTGGKKAFINFTRNLLLSEFPSYLPLDSTVIEILENVEVDQEVLAACQELGVRLEAYSPLAQGLLTGRYLSGEVPADSRAAVGHFLTGDRITPEYLAMARGLAEVASARGQSLAQLALAWALRDPRVTSAIIGASSVAQLEDNGAALEAPALTAEELAAIDGLLAAG